ncbi:MAG TPA: dCTP deaminase [Patescibacteria group bacterium]|nr:dCTP deaminase [Patescibacteria group bacterium]
MSVLTKKDILQRISRDELSFYPSLDEFQIQTHSVDLRLGFDFMIPKSWEMTEKGRTVLNIDYLSGVDRQHFETMTLEVGQHFELLPREFVVVNTLEKISLPADLMGILYPRSSVNRRGLSVDLSGIVDAGYKGNLIIPIRNNTPSQVIRIYPGERFCQLVFHQLNNYVKPHKSRFAENGSRVGIFREKSQQETKLIREGKVKELKRRFKINLS